jgi:periplasmic divalent cation tolerance protein
VAGLVVVMTTVPDRETGLTLGRRLVEDRLAACAQLLPTMTSIYRWQGQIHEEPEHLLLLKTPTAGRDALVAALVRQHPYEVPEVVVLDAAAVHPPYLAWAEAQTTGA